VLPQIARRLVATIPVMGVVAIAVFALLHVTPGDPAVIIAGDYATTEDIAKIRAKLGLDQPFLTQVTIWLGRIVRGDLGTSIYSGLPVATLIGQRAEATIALTLFAMIISVSVAVPLGDLTAIDDAPTALYGAGQARVMRGTARIDLPARDGVVLSVA